jgi:hypothetical protein
MLVPRTLAVALAITFGMARREGADFLSNLRPADYSDLVPDQ